LEPREVIMRPCILFVAALSLYCTPLRAQQIIGSLQALWKYADEHNVQISLSRKQKDIAEAGLHQAQSNFLPTVNINGAFTDNVSIQPTLVPAELFGGQSGTFVEEEFGKRYNYNAGLSAQLDLVNATNWFTLKGARFEESLSDLNWKLNQQTIYKATSNAYFTYYLMRESETLAEESLKIADVILTHARNLYQQGQISQVTLNTTTIHVKSASLSLLASRQSQQNALMQLKQMLDMSLSDSLILTDNLVIPLSDEPGALNSSADINVKLSQMQLLAANNSWQAAKAAYVPTLSAVYAYNTQITGEEILNFSNTNKLPQQYWGLRITLPVLTHGTRTFQIAKQRLEYETATKRYESASRQAAVNDDNLLDNYRSAREKLDVSHEIRELYLANDLHATRQFDAGQISLDERLRVYQDFINYKNEYLRNLSDFYMRYAELKVRQQQF
jgi:outer membrane protein